MNISSENVCARVSVCVYVCVCACVCVCMRVHTYIICQRVNDMVDMKLKDANFSPCHNPMHTRLHYTRPGS